MLSTTFPRRKGETLETRREAKMCMIHKRQQQAAQKRQREKAVLSRAPLNLAGETSFLSFIYVCGLLEAAGGGQAFFLTAAALWGKRSGT